MDLLASLASSGDHSNLPLWKKSSDFFLYEPQVASEDTLNDWRPLSFLSYK